MKRVLASLGVLLFTAGLALAGTWTGRLLDANCATRQTSAPCAPTSSTTAFAVDVNGKILKLDAKVTRKQPRPFSPTKAAPSVRKNQILKTPQ